jgi:hypothetical protein
MMFHPYRFFSFSQIIGWPEKALPGTNTFTTPPEMEKKVLKRLKAWRSY